MDTTKSTDCPKCGKAYAYREAGERSRARDPRRDFYFLLGLRVLRETLADAQSHKNRLVIPTGESEANGVEGPALGSSNAIVGVLDVERTSSGVCGYRGRQQVPPLRSLRIALVGMTAISITR